MAELDEARRERCPTETPLRRRTEAQRRETAGSRNRRRWLPGQGEENGEQTRPLARLGTLAYRASRRRSGPRLRGGPRLIPVVAVLISNYLQQGRLVDVILVEILIEGGSNLLLS